MKDPLVLGGQGRTSDDLQVEGAWMGALLVLAAFLLCILAGAKWLGFTE